MPERYETGDLVRYFDGSRKLVLPHYEVGVPVHKKDRKDNDFKLYAYLHYGYSREKGPLPPHCTFLDPNANLVFLFDADNKRIQLFDSFHRLIDLTDEKGLPAISAFIQFGTARYRPINSSLKAYRRYPSHVDLPEVVFNKILEMHRPAFYRAAAEAFSRNF